MVNLVADMETDANNTAALPTIRGILKTRLGHAETLDIQPAMTYQTTVNVE